MLYYVWGRSYHSIRGVPVGMLNISKLELPFILAKTISYVENGVGACSKCSPSRKVFLVSSILPRSLSDMLYSKYSDGHATRNIFAKQKSNIVTPCIQYMNKSVPP